MDSRKRDFQPVRATARQVTPIAAGPFSRTRLRVFLLGIALAGVTFAVLLPVTRNGFVGFDDEEYLLANPMVLAGITLEGLSWALGSVGHAGNWHPLTWISHMLDVTLFGTDPGGHHGVSLGLHVANGVLLLGVIHGMTGSLYRSGLAAALFSLHPLHVESLAWAAERKDVLSAFFWMLSLASYLWYVRKPGARRYLTVAAVFAAGLAAKPMLVTLPLVLLLLDYWPLHRFPDGVPRGGGMLPAFGRLAREKVPLLAIAVASAIVTILAQHRGDALMSLESYPLPVRLCNALVSYVWYLSKTLAPSGLAFYYPYAADLPAWQCGLAGLCLAAVTVVALRTRRDQPFLVVGWLCYLLMLAPVIGVIQVGGQARADRYTYLPLIGVFLIMAWAIGKLPLRPAGAAAIGLVILAAFAAGARAQVGVWRDESTLFEHAIRVTHDNWVAEYNLGVTLSEAGKLPEAEEHYRSALRLKPDYAEAHNNLGIALMRRGQVEDAIGHYDKALALKPGFAPALCNRAVGSLKLGRHEEAADFLRRALEIDASDPEVHQLLAMALTSAGRPTEAQPHFREAARLKQVAQ